MQEEMRELRDLILQAKNISRSLLKIERNILENNRSLEETEKHKTLLKQLNKFDCTIDVIQKLLQTGYM